MIKVILIFLTFSIQAWAQLNISLDIDGIYPTEISESDAKKMLLFEAARQAVKQLGPDLGFSGEEFDKKLQEKYLDYFSKYKDRKFIEKFGFEYRKSLSEGDQKEFEKSLEKERGPEFVNFSRTLEVLKSYSYKSVIRDESNPNKWKGSLNIIVDKEKLLKLYRRILYNEAKTYSRIILLPEVSLSNFSWNELGLENGDKFLAPLRLSWLKWLEKKIPDIVDESYACSKECKVFWGQWSEMAQEETLSRVPEEYVNSIWLKVDIVITRIEFNQSISRLGLEWTGRVILLDTNTKRTMASYELGRESKQFFGTDQLAINSALASLIYRLPLSAFVQIPTLLQNKVSLNRLSRLSIVGQKHMGDVLNLVESIKTRGASLGIEIQIDSFTKDTAQLMCFYKGEEKSFTDLLSGLKELKSSQGYRIVNEFNGVQNVLKLVVE